MSYATKANLATFAVILAALAVTVALFLMLPVLLIDGAAYVSGEFLVLSYPLTAEGWLAPIGIGSTFLGLAVAAGGVALVGKYVH